MTFSLGIHFALKISFLMMEGENLDLPMKNNAGFISFISLHNVQTL